MEPQSLVSGRTYYQLTFADRDSTMPGVKPLVFLGEVTLDDGRQVFALQDTVSYVRFGSRLEMTAENDEVMLYLMSAEEVRSIVDIAEVAREVAAAAARAASLNHPVLNVLRTGWRSVP
jgi:hypothetical protein